MTLADRLQSLVMRWFRVPAEPDPPPGDPATLRVFRAAPSWFYYTLIGWGLGQLGTLTGLLIGFALDWGFLEDLLDNFVSPPVLFLIEAAAWITFVGQLLLSFAALRLGFDNRWYMLSDRALRIREGVLRVRERTMTFANIQQIAVKQGPLQRLLGIADVEVRTAGGGSSGEKAGESMHRGYLRGVSDAESIRDTIRQRVEAYREAGLAASQTTTPDAASLPAAALPAAALPRATAAPPATVDAARELLDEARALRDAVASRR